MKRHTSLIPLSHDHHDGLVIAQNLILGRSKAPRSTWPPDRRQQVDRLLEFFRHDLQPHFRAEEEHVFPVAEQDLAQGEELIRELRHDHDRLRARIDELARDPTRDLEARLPAFGEELRAHIHKEERVLFERMQQEMTPTALAAVGAALRGLERPPYGACHV